MKTFQFRLEQALRWRSTQLDLEKARASVAAQRLRLIRDAIETHGKQLSNGAAELAAGASAGASFALWATFRDKSHRQIGELETQAAEAEKALAAQTMVVVEADRKLKLLENLKENARRQWQAQFDHELEAFAGESYLFSLQSRERTGA